MKARHPEKNALIIFNPAFEADARAYVQEHLQYRERYSNFYMLPMPAISDDVELSQAELSDILKNKKITRDNTDSYVISKKDALVISEAEGSQCYSSAVLQCAKSFKRHFIAITYDHAQGERKFSSLEKVRTHQRFSTSQGFAKGAVAQVPLTDTRRTAKKQKKTKDKNQHDSKNKMNDFLDWTLADVDSDHPIPPFDYLLLSGMAEKVKWAEDIDDTVKQIYFHAIQERIALRQQKVDPILRSVEQNYLDPVSVAVKLGNLFHAYANSGLVSLSRSHRGLANEIASSLFAYQPQEPWRDLGECLQIIKSKVDASNAIINPRGAFQGLLLEIHHMMENQTIFQVGDQVNDSWDEKCQVLKGLAVGKHEDISQCVSDILRELEKLKQTGKHYGELVRAMDSSIDLLQNPTEANRNKQYQVAYEVGLHPLGRVLGGLLLRLLNLILNIVVRLEVFLTGKASVFGGYQSLFSKQPIQENMEKLADLTSIEKVNSSGLCSAS